MIRPLLQKYIPENPFDVALIAYVFVLKLWPNQSGEVSIEIPYHVQENTATPFVATALLLIGVASF